MGNTCYVQKDKQYMSSKQVILLGTLGSGKTTLFNTICKKLEKTKFGGESITKQLTISESCEGQGFRILDTPGFGAVTDRLAHSIGILAGLTEGPINRILIVVRYERLGMMIEQATRICKVVWKYMPLVTVIITHWDLCEDKAQEQKSIEEQFKKSFKINSFIYSFQKITAAKICGDIDKCLEQTAQQLYVSQTEFDVLFENLDLDFELDCLKEEFSRQFEIFANTVKEFINQLKQGQSDQDDILHSLIVFIKQSAEEQMLEFEKKGGNTMNQIFNSTGSEVIAYFTHIELKKSIMSTVQNLIELCQRRMILSPHHPFNLLKMCNFCGLVWMKVQGCSGQTFCGKVPDQDEIMQGKQFTKYKFEYSNKKISFQLLKQEQSKIQFKLNNGNKQEGCKKPIAWDTMLSLDQNIKEQLLQENLFDYLCNKKMENPVCQKWVKYKQEMLYAAQQAIKRV
ncbi:hypothetical protein pb186bvf_014242 [Paramecium bursaria]